MAARLAECSMYILFAAALLPLAMVEAHTLATFVMHPAALEVRDSALEATLVATVVSFALYLLVPTALLAIVVLVAGSREARLHAVALVVALGLTLFLLLGAGRFAFNSWGRVTMESVPLLLLLLLTVVFLVRRLRPAAPATKRGTNGG